MILSLFTKFLLTKYLQKKIYILYMYGQKTRSIIYFYIFFKYLL